MTWENLRDEAQLAPHEVGYVLAANHAAATWTEVLAPFVTAAALPDPVNSTNLMHQYADQLEALYALVVVQDRVQVLYGLRPCHEVAGQGGRYFALIGERGNLAGTPVPPKLYTLAGAIGVQEVAFRRALVAAPSEADIVTAFGANANLELVAPLVQGQAAQPPDEVSTLKTLPIHPKLACLFMRGMSVRQAFFLMRRVKDATPQGHRPQLDQLVRFMRIAATHNGAPNNPASASASGWTRKDHAQAPALETWYYNLVARYAPTLVLPPVPQGAPAAGPPGPQDAAIQSVGLALADVLDTRFGDMPARTTSTEAAAKPYAVFERENLFAITGVEKPWEGLPDDVLPEFWNEFKVHRPKAMNPRGFIESYYKKNYPKTRTGYTFVVTTKMIKDFKTCVFSGEDQRLTYGNRHAGLSFYSMAPLGDTSDADGLRKTFIIYEETEGQHRPADRAEAEQLASALAQNPSTREGVIAWVEHSEIFLTIFFSAACPAVKPLKKILTILKNNCHFTEWTGGDFRGLVWCIHRGLRSLVAGNGITVLSRVALDVDSGKGFASKKMPAELQLPAFISDGSSVSTGTSSLSGLSALTGGSGGSGGGGGRGSFGGGGGGVPPPTKRLRGSATGAPCAAQFKPDIERAVKACEAKRQRFLTSKLVPRNEMHKILGPQFLALVPAGQTTCFNHFICGLCAKGDACLFCHRLTQAPSKQVLDGIGARLKTRVDRFVADLAKG